MNTARRNRILLLVGIILIAFNLRPTLSSVGPLIEYIEQDFGLSSAMLGLLTSLPLIAFAIISAFTSLFTKRYGIARTLLFAMGILTLATIFRVYTGVIGMYIGTLLIGVSIAFGNVLIPALTKQSFPEKAGKITSIYSSVMAIGAAVSAGISVPLVTSFGLSWRESMAIWALLSLIAFIAWLPQLSRIPRYNSRRTFSDYIKKMSSIRLVWHLALFMGFQSMTFYVILAWLPTILYDAGNTATYAGWMLSLSQATGILGSIIIPLWAGKKEDQRGIIYSLIVIEVIALTGLMFPDIGLVGLWVSMIGFVLGGTFGLVLLLFVLKAQDTDTSAELSGFVQSVGYIIAATGPIITGVIFDFTLNWNYVILFLIAISVGKFIFGLRVTRPGKI